MDIYAHGHAPYASKNRVKRGCLQPRREVGLGWIPVAEVKREGFYEAVMADKVSLRPHRRGLLRYCTQVTVQQYLFAVVYSLTFSRLSGTTHATLYFKPFTHFLYRHEPRLYRRV